MNAVLTGSACLLYTGTLLAPEGRSSAFVSGPSGVRMTFMLRLGKHLSGSFKTPLRCRDVGVGCWVQDGGPACSIGLWETVAISVLGVVTPPLGSQELDGGYRNS